MGVRPALLRWHHQRGWVCQQRCSSCSVAGQPSWLDVEPAALATSVAVMAPALTESAGPQKPENLIPALPAGGFLTADQAKQVCLSTSVHPSKASNANHKTKVCQNREVLAQFVVSANVQPTKIDEQCLQGIPKDLIDDVINLKFGSGLDSLSDLIAAAAPTSLKKEDTEVKEKSVAIMSDPSMGDPADMCFLKSIMGPNVELEDESVINDLAGQPTQQQQPMVEDKQNDVVDERSLEQIMGFASEMNVQSVDIGQNVDEILQVIKSIENAESDDMVSNRLVGSCEVGPSSQVSVGDGVPESIFPDGEAFPLNLLNDVDVMGLCNDQLSDQPPPEVPPPNTNLHLKQQQQQQMFLQQQQETAKLNLLAQQQTQVERRQHELERKASFLERRLRKLQSRLLVEHSAEQAGHVLELAQQSAKKFFHQDLATLTPKVAASRFPELAASLSSFLSKIQKNCSAQSNSIAVRQRNNCRYFGSGSKDNYGPQHQTNRASAFGVPQIKIDGEQLEKVAGPLATKLKILQSAYDSDCTASSSGGESCDEMQTFNNPHQQQLPISKRASWRYAQDRASVASRWTWLQAQISDLEYKIRQHNELQRQIRSSKGVVLLEATVSPPSTDPTVNGYSGLLPGASTTSTTTATTNTIPTLSGSSRTRPFASSLYRKRKLVQLNGLHEISKKAARASSLRCNCDGTLPDTVCALCTGRKEPTIGQEPFDLMSVQSRIAAVDPGYHPVLSMPDEVPHTIHMDAIMRSVEWQQKTIRGGMRVAKSKDKESNERRSKKSTEHRTKYPARLKKSQTTLISARIKRKVLKGKRNHNGSERSTNCRKRSTTKQHNQVQHHHSQNSQQALSSTLQQLSQTSSHPTDEEEEACSALSSSSKYSSPVPSPSPASLVAPSHTHEKNTLREKSSNTHSHSRLRQNSYDIDNIVIPYSVAASTRLEKLPYKEIQIPKWRLCDDSPNTDIKNGAMQKVTPDEDFEDVSDEAIALRHERSEKEENKRFMNYISLPYHSRIRHNRRMESRTDSGANTPDPMSPHTSEFGGDTMSPFTSPPATPSNVHETNDQQQQSTAEMRSSALQNAVRRRTFSQSARSVPVFTASQIKDEPCSSLNDEEQEQANPQVLPYEPRIFPLTDEDYNKMLEVMPKHLQPTLGPVCPIKEEEEKIDGGEADYHESDSTESALCDLEGEDPNDPEWTVAEARETEKERIRPTAKR